MWLTAPRTSSTWKTCPMRDRVAHVTQVVIDMNIIPRPDYYFITERDLHPVVARFAEQHAWLETIAF